MPRASKTFRQADVIRALRAAQAAGLDVAGYTVDPITGKIVVATKPAGEPPAPETELDKWMASRARSA